MLTKIDTKSTPIKWLQYPMGIIVGLCLGVVWTLYIITVPIKIYVEQFTHTVNLVILSTLCYLTRMSTTRSNRYYLMFFEMSKNSKVFPTDTTFKRTLVTMNWFMFSQIFQLNIFFTTNSAPLNTRRFPTTITYRIQEVLYKRFLIR